MSVVLVDIGNTRTTLALGDGDSFSRVTHGPSHENSPAAARKTLKQLLRGRDAEGSVLCSVVPDRTGLWQEALGRASTKQPLVVNHRVKLGISIDYPQPATIGADRLANACAAVSRYGAPVIVADFGTALTFDVVSRQRAYVGGVIAPGLPLMTDYLCERTALLPRVRLPGTCPPVGRSTLQAMRIGAHIGYRGIVREIVTYLRKDPRLKGARLCATGGFAGWALEGLDLRFSIDPHLILHGLARIHALNSETG